MAWDDGSYNDVASRIAEFRAKYPDGRLRMAAPWRIEVIDGQAYVAYSAAAYRTPDDPAPGIGCAWEYVPGKTNFTRGSELQNAETSAWGRAIVATLAADTKSVSSAEEVRNREAEHGEPMPARSGGAPVCARCGKSLAGASVEVVAGDKVHKGGCPGGA